MTKVLIVIPWFSPAYKAGGPIQSIRNLVGQNIDAVHFDIFCSNKDIDGLAIHDVVTDQWVNFNIHTRVWYSSSQFPFLQLKKIVRDQQIDKILIIGLYSYSFNILPWLFLRNSIKIISVRGMLHPEALKLKSYKKYFFLFFIRLFHYHKKVDFHATDDVERNHIFNALGKKMKVSVAGNFINSFPKYNVTPKLSGQLKLITIALVSPMKNHLLILKALAYCKADIEFHIVGSIKDKEYWDECKFVIQQLPVNIKVLYHGHVHHHDINRYLDGANVMILPSKSENFGHAMIESLLAGIPIITSHQTPWNNLQHYQAGLNINPVIEELVPAIEYFASLNNDSYVKCSNAARKYAIDAYDERQLVNQYIKMFNN